MKYVIDRVNNSTSLLKGLKLGYLIFDVCVEKDLNHIIRSMIKNTTVGVIGPTKGTDVSMVAVAMNIFDRAVIAFNLEQIDIDLRPSFHNLFRAVPSIEQLTQAMTDFVAFMKWNYIGVFYQNNDYGLSAHKYIKSQLRRKKICIFDSLRRDLGTESTKYAKTLENSFLIKDKRVGVFLLFLEEEDLSSFIHGLKSFSSEKLKNITFLASGKWGTKKIIVNGVEDVTRGVITFQSAYTYVEEFENYFENLNPLNYELLADYWKEIFNSNSTDNNRKEIFKARFGYFNQSPASKIINSVNAFVSVLQKLWKDKMSVSHILRNNAAIMTLIDGLRSSRSVYPFDKTLFDFTSARRINSHFEIFNFQKVNGKQYEYIRIGHWHLVDPEKFKEKEMVIHDNMLVTPYSQLTVNVTSIKWPFTRPKSTCSTPCKNNQRKRIADRHVICCWHCDDCKENDVLINNECIACGKDKKSNTTLSVCESLPVRMIKINQILVIIVQTLSILGIVLTMTACSIFFFYYKEHVIRASSRELSMLMFVGITVIYVVPLVEINASSRELCILKRWLLYIGFTLAYSPLLFKTNRIYRIFTTAKSSTVPPKAVSPISQIGLTTILCMAQTLLSIPSINSMDVAKQYPQHKNSVEIYCKNDSLIFFINFAYVLSIMSITMYFAFKCRNFPKNCNETKDIGITMYITCFTFGVGLTSYLLLENKRYKIVAISIVCIFCATVLLFGLFTTKFMVLYQSKTKPKSEDDSNNKERTITRSSVLFRSGVELKSRYL